MNNCSRMKPPWKRLPQHQPELMKIDFGPLGQKGVSSEVIVLMDFEFNLSRVPNQKSAWCNLSAKIVIQTPLD
jgi:hypothetical protein